MQINSITLRTNIIKKTQYFEVDDSKDIVAMKKNVLNNDKKFIRK